MYARDALCMTCLRDAEDDEDVAEGGEDGQEDDGEAPVVGRGRRRREGGGEGRRIEAERRRENEYNTQPEFYKVP